MALKLGRSSQLVQASRSWGMTSVTNPKQIAKAVGENSCNCLLLKLNQIGSVTETMQACKLAQSKGWSVMVFIDLGRLRILSMLT